MQGHKAKNGPRKELEYDFKSFYTLLTPLTSCHEALLRKYGGNILKANYFLTCTFYPETHSVCQGTWAGAVLGLVHLPTGLPSQGCLAVVNPQISTTFPEGQLKASPE